MARIPKSQKMKELAGSGQSRKEFIKAHGLTEGKVQYWMKKFSGKPLNPKCPLENLFRT